MSKPANAVHPGEIIREEFLAPLGKSAYWLAKGMGIPTTRVQEILAERRGVSVDSAMRLSRFLGCSPQFWLNLQLTIRSEW
jgi:addiction module HigA family antidote